LPDVARADAARARGRPGGGAEPRRGPGVQPEAARRALRRHRRPARERGAVPQRLRHRLGGDGHRRAGRAVAARQPRSTPDARPRRERAARHQPVESVLLRLCRMAERQVPGVVASLMLLQEGTLRNVGPNLPPAFADALAPRLLTLAAALCARAELNGRFACSDISKDVEWAAFREASFAHGLRGCWAAPVRSSEGDFLGMVVLFLRNLREVDEWGQRLLDQAARLAAVAIEHRELAQQLTHRAFHDPLTGLPNRVLLEERLEQAVARARRQRTSVALLAIDLDHFKHVNDTFGHEDGDELLQQ